MWPSSTPPTSAARTTTYANVISDLRGSDSSDWPTTITGPLSERTRVCAYDRAGTGASDAAPNKPRLLLDVVRDLDIKKSINQLTPAKQRARP